MKLYILDTIQKHYTYWNQKKAVGLAITTANLAVLQANMGEVDAARTVLEEVVEVSVAQLGASHRITEFAKTQLAQLGR